MVCKEVCDTHIQRCDFGVILGVRIRIVGTWSSWIQDGDVEGWVHLCCLLHAEWMRDGHSRHKWGKAWRLLPPLFMSLLVGRVHSFPSDPHVFAWQHEPACLHDPSRLDCLVGTHVRYSHAFFVDLVFHSPPLLHHMRNTLIWPQVSVHCRIWFYINSYLKMFPSFSAVGDFP